MLGVAGEQDPAFGLGQRGHGRRDADAARCQRRGQHDLDLVGIGHGGQLRVTRWTGSKPAGGSKLTPDSSASLTRLTRNVRSSPLFCHRAR